MPMTALASMYGGITSCCGLTRTLSRAGPALGTLLDLDEAELAVVVDGDLDGDVFLQGRHQIAEQHRDAAVAAKAPASSCRMWTHSISLFSISSAIRFNVSPTMP